MTRAENPAQRLRDPRSSPSPSHNGQGTGSFGAVGHPVPDTTRSEAGLVQKGGYAELAVTSNFTFLTGASHPEELMLRASELGLSAIAVTDRNSLAGVVRAYSALKALKEQQADHVRVRSSHQVDSCTRREVGHPVDLDIPHSPQLPKLLVGARLVLRDCPLDWIALPQDHDAYKRLSRLLSVGKARAPKGECYLDLADLEEWACGMILIAVPPAGRMVGDLVSLAAPLQRIHRSFPATTYLGAAPRYDGSDQAWFDGCAALAMRCSTPMVAMGDVVMHHGGRRPLADVLTCMRDGIGIDQIGTRALPNGERRLKGAQDMAWIFRRHPAAIRRTLEIAARCSFDLSHLSYSYPVEGTADEAPQARLERLVRAGVRRRYPDGAPERVKTLMDKELALVAELDYAPYFLTVNDIVAEARARDILCQGRGSAANSILCYLLGITDVSPDMIGMVVERFISRHRREPPDIDVDFEHERREEIIQWIYRKYGRHRAGLCATVIHFRARAAIREVGKVMGLSQDITTRLSGDIWGHSHNGADPERVRALGLDPDDRRLALTLRLIGEIIGFPRHLSQHVGGFVITQDRLDALCPIENAAMEGRTCIEWDKDDIDALGILKVDILSLGMLTCLHKGLDLLARHEGITHTLATIPQDDAPTYEMLTRADAVGVFQVESRAQMNFLPRMKPRIFYDLVIEVAIVRPGPIQGGMVKPYIRRRQGLEAPEPFGPALEAITRKTLGVPLFQEQAMQIAIVGAGYAPDEADHLRRSLASFRRMGTIGAHRDRFVRGMRERGYAQDVADACFAQIEGFADYGFPESHAAAFALLTYVSSWMKCHHPAIFACALLNSQPMGFYAPAQIVRDVRDHGVDVRPVCVNHSEWDSILERSRDGRLALRLGFRQIKGFRAEEADWIVAARGNGYPDPESLWLRAGTAPKTLESLAEADAFANLGLTRRDALWAVKAIRSSAPLPLFSNPLDGEGLREPAVDLAAMHLGEEVVEDYLTMRLSLRAHPMELLRPLLCAGGQGAGNPGVANPGMGGDLTPHDRLVAAPLGSVTICGLVITRQRPGTSSGVIFLTLEDETGVANVVVWPKLYQKYRRAVMGGRLLRITGRLEREGIVTHVIASVIEDVSGHLSQMNHPMSDAVGETHAPADAVPRHSKMRPTALHPREQAKRLFPSRDFH